MANSPAVKHQTLYSLAELTDELIAEPRFAKARRLYKISKEWNKIVGDELSQHSNPVSISSKGVLTIAASDSVWLNELAMIKDVIIKRIKKIKGIRKNSIKDLRFVWKQEQTTQTIDHIEITAKFIDPPQYRQPTDLDFAFVENCVKNIEDKELKRLLGEIIIKDICRTD